MDEVESAEENERPIRNISSEFGRHAAMGWGLAKIGSAAGQ